MSELVPREYAAERLPVSRPPRWVQRMADDAAAEGLVAAARLQAAAWVAQDGMMRTAMLSAQEQRLMAADPLVADRYAGFVDDFVAVARNELRRMGLR